jgi:hypothetical protein
MKTVQLGHLGAIATALFKDFGCDTFEIAERTNHPQHVVEREMHNHMQRGSSYGKARDTGVAGTMPRLATGS